MTQRGSAIPALTREEVAENRRSRRHPRRTQWDYLHLRRLVDDLARALGDLPGPRVSDVLDIWCGSRPYEDLLPEGARCTGLDIDDHYGVADVVSTEFLPFDDASFDLVTCIEAFHYVEDPAGAASEIARVLRPDGLALVTVPHVYDYEPTTYERRYTAPELERVFRDWRDLRVVENGGRAVVWSAVTARLVQRAARARERTGKRRLQPVFAAAYAAINSAGAALERFERRHEPDPMTLPMNLLLVARRPATTG
jgi:SAM-dependent methyltransferase